MSGNKRLIAIFLALVGLIVSACLAIDIPGTEINISFQTIAICLIGYFLGARSGLIVVGLYILCGTLGLDIFSSADPGLGVWSSPSAGYLLGFMAAIPIAAHARGGSFLLKLMTFIVAHGVILCMGAIGLIITQRMGLDQAIDRGIYPFLISGLIKAVISAMICSVPRLESGSELDAPV